jgi:glyoxylase I family protein
MRILGLCFAGTATDQRDAMREFLQDVLGLTTSDVPGIEADWFELPDGTAFAVASPGGMGETGRSIGFLVEDLDAALAELRAAGVETDDEVSENAVSRYAHFVAPDGRLYELVERL